MSSNVLAFPETIPSGFKIASHSEATAYSANIPVQTQDLPLFDAGGPIVSGPAAIDRECLPRGVQKYIAIKKNGLRGLLALVVCVWSGLNPWEQPERLSNGIRTGFNEWMGCEY